MRLLKFLPSMLSASVDSYKFAANLVSIIVDIDYNLLSMNKRIEELEKKVKMLEDKNCQLSGREIVLRGNYLPMKIKDYQQ